MQTMKAMKRCLQKNGPFSLGYITFMEFCERKCKLRAGSRLNSVHLILSTAAAKELYACSAGKTCV